VIYDRVSKSFRNGHLEQKLQIVQLSATRCSCIASLVSFAAITLCVASQRVFVVAIVVYFVIDSVRKLSGYAIINLSLPGITSIFNYKLQFICSLLTFLSVF